MARDGREHGAAGTVQSVSVVVPTYKEVLNLPKLVARLDAVRPALARPFELLIVDDNSKDGTVELVGGMGHDWVRLIVRTVDRGLSQSVLEGVRSARNDAIVVMDADLSHPPEAIPAMITALETGAEMVVGSRYVAGGSTEDDWGLFRWLNSKVATLMARPLTSIKDPMAGFFALRRGLLARAAPLNPIGYKILLELLVKTRARPVVEVPIRFADRHAGESKLSFKEQLRYIQHLRRLFLFKHPELSHAAQFGVVGASGVVVNLAVLSVLLLLGARDEWAIAAGIGVSILTNFFMNRRFTFSYARRGSIVAQLGGYVASSLLGAVVNYLVATWMADVLPQILLRVQIAAVIGVGAGMFLNFAFSRLVVFRKPAARPLDPAATPAPPVHAPGAEPASGP